MKENNSGNFNYDYRHNEGYENINNIHINVGGEFQAQN
jgi:hypothetical protein